MTFGYAFDFQLGDYLDGTLDMYNVVIKLCPSGTGGTTVKYTVTYNPVCDQASEERWRSNMTNSYLSWAKNAGKLARKNPVKYELIEDDDVKVGMINMDDGKMNAFGF